MTSERRGGGLGSPARVVQGPRGGEGGDLTQGALCDLRAEGWWLGVPIQVVQQSCSREDGGLETPCTMGPCSEEGMVTWGIPHKGSVGDPIARRDGGLGTPPLGGMGTVQPGRRCNRDPHLGQLRTPQQGEW